MRRNKGLTILEIMVVAAIIAVLAAITSPALVRSRASAYKSSASTAMHQIYVAARMYADDENGMLPITQTTVEVAASRREGSAALPPHTIPMALHSYGVTLELCRSKLDPGPDELTRKYPDLIDSWQSYLMDNYVPGVLKMPFDSAPIPASISFLSPSNEWPALKLKEPCVYYDGHEASPGTRGCLSSLPDNTL